LLKITSPLSGTVVYVNVKPGEVTDPETLTPLVEVVDLSRLIIAANVPSSQMPAVKVGQTVEIVPQQGAAPDNFGTTETATPNPAPVALMGTVTLIEDRIDPKTDMGPVDISVPAKARLRPGQFVRVRIITEERRDCLTVPSRSIVKNESGEWVIYLVSGKQAIQQPVKVGFREGDMVQVHSLILQPGDKVVTTGAYGLPGKTRIRILSE
jgi:RND family efflux transporter MFP subunit